MSTSTLKPRWNLEDKHLWLDSFITLLPAVLADVPNYDNDDKLIPVTEFETRILDRVEICAKASDKVLEEMQFRFWDNARGRLEDKVRFGRGNGRGKGRGNGGDSGRSRQKANK